MVPLNFTIILIFLKNIEITPEVELILIIIHLSNMMRFCLTQI